MGAGHWTDALAFHTVNGSITLDLPSDLSTDVHASTVNGEISADISGMVDALPSGWYYVVVTAVCGGQVAASMPSTPFPK